MPLTPSHASWNESAPHSPQLEQHGVGVRFALDWHESEQQQA